MSVPKNNSSSSKKFQLTIPQDTSIESPDTSPANLKQKNSVRVEDAGAKIFSDLNSKTSKNLASSKKESLENLKKHQSDMKRQKQNEDAESSNENLKNAEKSAPKKNQKTPYEILFEQNQHIANELEMSKAKAALKDAHINQLDSENFTLREYIIGLENNMERFQETHNELIEDYQNLKNEVLELRSHTKNSKDSSHIEAKAFELFNQLHMFILDKPYNGMRDRQSCIMSSTISSNGMNPIDHHQNASTISFDSRISLNSSNNQQLTTSKRSHNNSSNSVRETSQNSDLISSSNRLKDEVEEGIDEEMIEEEVEEMVEYVEEGVEEEEGAEESQEEQEVETEEDEEIEENIEEEVEEKEHEEEEEEEEEEEGPETEEDEEREEYDEEMEESDVVIGNDQTEYTIQQNVEPGLCTILEVTELGESRMSISRPIPDSTYSLEEKNEENACMDNYICIDDSEIIDHENSSTKVTLPTPEQSGRRKSVTFSANLTQEKIIENTQENSGKKVLPNIKLTTEPEIIESEHVRPSDQRLPLPGPRPILKSKQRPSLSNQTDDEIQVRRSVCRRKSSISGENPGGDRRRSRIYSLAGSDDKPLISEELIAQAEAFAAAEHESTIENHKSIESSITEASSSAVLPAKASLPHKPPNGNLPPKVPNAALPPKSSNAILPPKPPSAGLPPKPKTIFKSKQRKDNIKENSENESANEPAKDQLSDDKENKAKHFEELSDYLSGCLSQDLNNSKTKPIGKKAEKTPRNKRQSLKKTPSTPTNRSNDDKDPDFVPSLTRSRSKSKKTKEIKEIIEHKNQGEEILSKPEEVAVVTKAVEKPINTKPPEIVMTTKPVVKKKSFLGTKNMNIENMPSESILPRKSIETIYENKELDISENEIIDCTVLIKDEPIECSSELSNNDSGHKENRPDSPVKHEGRRARKPISYKELSVGTKMRRDGNNIIIKQKDVKLERW